eukprot:TRINITY_DN70558_c0_g1_i1.p1 TRINITY_DN70558_c0_g1~~TRINITY_DN70558_c0_g1_i1.p1  ORF type:complete len:767 (+),score=157.03 TRINITY_DN70558_c0_g1_i1:103-2403(+)
MNFPVPWRCLLPSEAVDFVTYNGNAILRELSDLHGAMIDVSGERDSPPRLSDRILTISGLAEQKEGACRGIVDKLRRLQDLQSPEELGIFVIILPAAAIPVVVGAKGVTIKEIIEGSRVELSIGKENVMGMPDTPIGLEGTALQVVGAVAAIHRVVQDMADRGRLQPSDFKYRPDKAALALAAGAGQGLPEVNLPPAGHNSLGGLDPTQNYRTKAKIIVDTQAAGWLIGRQGRTIREMQENSGAFLHVLREDEIPPMGLPAGTRIVEVCGRYERKLEGVAVIMRQADNMPGGQAPRDTQVIVPRLLAQSFYLDEIAEETACVLEPVIDRDGLDEAVVCIAGPIANRIRAAQAFMRETDKAHMDGLVVALSVDGEVIGKDGRMRKEIRDDPDLVQKVRAAAAPPPNPKHRDLPENGGTAENIFCDEPWPPQLQRGAVGQPMPPASDSRPNGALEVSAEQRREEERRRQEAEAAKQRQQEDELRRQRAATAMDEERRRRQAEEEAHARAQLNQQADEQRVRRLADEQELRFAEERRLREQQHQQPQDEQQEQREAAEQSRQRQQAGEQEMRLAQEQRLREQQQQQQREAERMAEERRLHDQREMERRRQQEQDALAEKQKAFAVHEGNSAAPPHCPPPPEESHEPRATATSWSSCGPGPLGDPDMAMGLQQIMLRNACCGNANSQLLLLLPIEPLRGALVPSGFLQQVAQWCAVQIDLGSEMPTHGPDGKVLQVLLTGSVLGTSIASFWLQEGLSRCCGRGSTCRPEG